jgi:hypothetical protein
MSADISLIANPSAVFLTRGPNFGVALLLLISFNLARKEIYFNDVISSKIQKYIIYTNNSSFMGRNDLFLDSGIIYGDIDLSDETWHAPCHDHFKKFPRKIHNYYSAKRIIDEEIHSVSKRRRRDGLIKSDKILRLIVMKGKALFDNNEIKDIDYINSKKEIYDTLFKIINSLLLRKRTDGNPKDRDAHLLTNAFLWDNENRSLHNPHFITIDYTDIKKNEKELVSEAMACLGIAPCLQFCLILPKQAS